VRSLSKHQGAVTLYGDNDPQHQGWDIKKAVDEVGGALAHSVPLHSNTNPHAEARINYNRTVARVMGIHGGLPAPFAGILQKQACKLHGDTVNRSDGKTLRQRFTWEDKPPNATFDHQQGSFAVTFNPNESNKANTRGEICVYLGNGSLIDQGAGFLLYSVERKVVFATPSAVINPKQMPFYDGLLARILDTRLSLVGKDARSATLPCSGETVETFLGRRVRKWFDKTSDTPAGYYMGTVTDVDTFTDPESG